MYLLPRALPTAQRRSFVSTVLLSRTWDSETVVELRKEARARGLSTKGNKAALIARIREHEADGAAPTSPPLRPPGTARNASSDAHVVPPKKTAQAVSPGIPLPAVSNGAPAHSDFIAVKLPNLSRRLPDAPVQVPHVPDFWNSAQSKSDAPFEPVLPKLHVVSGSVTHYDGGPTHNLEKHEEDGSPSVIVRADRSRVHNEVGFWADLWESFGLPRSFSARRTLSEARSSAALAEETRSQTHSRPLTDGERKGLYVLLGIVGGSWLVGGVVNRSTIVGEEHDTQSQH